MSPSWHRAAASAALGTGLLLGAPATGLAAPTVLDSQAGHVQSCPLPGTAEPPLDPGGDPVFCRDRPPREPAMRGDPAVETVPEDSDDEGDAFRSLGGGSPFCARRVDAAAQRNCRRSGALAHPYPVGNYGFDIHINTGVTRIKSNLLMAVQTLASFAWLGLLYLVKGVLLLLEWAFSLDLLSDALSDLRRALLRLHRTVLGETWLLTALAVTGLWGIWRGLVQRRTTETLAGLAATVALMVAALVLINDPVGTVGYASRLSNETALGLLSGASTGTVSEGPEALSRAQRGLFEMLVLRPWCALEFADVRFCLAKPPDDLPHRVDRDGTAATVADLWLRYPAGGGVRDDLYERWKQDGNPSQPKVRIQKEGQTATRLALVLLIAIGLVGALLVLFWLGVRLLAQAVLAFVLLLAAPAMLFAPALGETGRRAFVGWAKRLFVAVIAKAIYAFLLALVLVAAGLLAEFQSLGFIGLWLIQIVFWWGLFLKRRELLGFLSADTDRGRARRSVVRRMGAAMAPLAAVRASGGAIATPARLATGLARDRADVTRRGTQTAAEGTLAEHAEGALAGQLGAARQTLERDRQLGEDLKHTERFLAKYDKQAQLHKAKGIDPPPTSQDERAMLARREALQNSRAPEEQLRQGRSLVATADRNLALSGREFSDRDRERLIEQRRRDLEEDLPLDHERNLRFAGIDPDDYHAAEPVRRAQLDQQVREARERDRRLFAALPEDARLSPSRADLERAAIEVPHDQVRERVRRERAARRELRSARHRRDRLYRPR